jgi:hypothetical protein
MLEAYMDESGIQDGAHICCVAGYWVERTSGGDLRKGGRKLLKMRTPRD